MSEEAIRAGLAHFARILDGKHWDRVDTVFASDATFDYGLGEASGIEALVANFRRYLDRCGATQHLIGSILIELDGERATSHAYVQARHVARDPDGRFFDSNGEYVDRWERRGEGWRIVRRDARWFMHTGDPSIIGA